MKRFFPGAALLLILVALLHAQRRRNRLEKEMVERARTTDLYRALRPGLRNCPIRRDSSMLPPGWAGRTPGISPGMPTSARGLRRPRCCVSRMGNTG